MNTTWNKDQEYATFSSSLSQTRSPLLLGPDPSFKEAGVSTEYGQQSIGKSKEPGVVEPQGRTDTELPRIREGVCIARTGVGVIRRRFRI